MDKGKINRPLMGTELAVICQLVVALANCIMANLGKKLKNCCIYTALTLILFLSSYPKPRVVRNVANCRQILTRFSLSEQANW